jgi:sugar phosphate isomerase/epimerase
VWGDGDPAGVNERAAQEMLATVQAAPLLGVTLLTGFTGSPLWASVMGYPAATSSEVADGLRAVVRAWSPILDACRDAGLRFALEVHPGELAYDLYSAEMVLDAFDGREELGFLFDPSHLHWTGVDPCEFLHRFHDRIYHVHVKDASIRLNGRTSLLNSYAGPGDARRGWEFRAPGHGGIDWEALIRALNRIGYDGAFAVEWGDAGMLREQGAAAARAFVQRLDFPAPPPQL